VNHGVVFALVLAWPGAALAEEFTVSPTSGNSGFAAAFDDALGELNVAVSSSIECALTFDEGAGTVSGRCAVPLTSVRVDNNDAKTGHFRQWVTNNQSDPKHCAFEAVFREVKVGKLVAEKPVPFTGEVVMTVCGRSRVDGGTEKLSGAALLFPPTLFRERRAIRIRAVIATFHRDAYHIDPKYTEGWLARLESLADVVAEWGSIDLSLFAEAAERGTAALAASPAPESKVEGDAR